METIQRYHSISIDMILDLSQNILPMTAKMVMMTIAFISFDTNGTILVAGVFERAFANIEQFRSDVMEKNIYVALTKILLEIASEHGSTVTGSSEIPRYNYPNDRRPMTFNASEEFCKRALELSNNLRKQVTFKDKADFKNFKAFQSTLPKGCTPSQYKKVYLDSRCKAYLKEIQSAAGFSVGHILSLTFFQLACLTGLLPSFLYGWASISKGSGGYSFINSALKVQKNVSVKEANRWMEECHSELQNAISPNVNLGLIENMLCEFKREEASPKSVSRKKDCIFLLAHRGSWQNLFRLEFNSWRNARLIIRLGSKSISTTLLGKNKLTVDVGSLDIVRQSKFKTPKHEALICWINDTETGVLEESSKLYLSPVVRDFFKLVQ